MLLLPLSLFLMLTSVKWEPVIISNQAWQKTSFNSKSWNYKNLRLPPWEVKKLGEILEMTRQFRNGNTFINQQCSGEIVIIGI